MKWTWCRDCLGSGRYISGYNVEANGKPCPTCQATGKVKLSKWEQLITFGVD
jgi:DnaJ-class molecular chaperone